MRVMDTLWQPVYEILAHIGPRDVLDILVVAALIYWLGLALRGTRALPLIKGIITVIILIASTKWLPTLNWILSGVMTVGVIALVVIFQPELRMALEHLGRGGPLSSALGLLTIEQRQQVFSEVVDAAVGLSQKGYGALIVLERTTGLVDITRTGRTLNARVSVELLHTIFHPRTPLHDGAVVIRGSQLVAAACVLPHSESPGLATTVGMRHRAALGLAERTDAVVVVVSEETGAISLAVNGSISPRLEKVQLTERILELFEAERERTRFFFWRK
jgi:diadenylate cyclase